MDQPPFNGIALVEGNVLKVPHGATAKIVKTVEDFVLVKAEVGQVLPSGSDRHCGDEI